MKGKIIIDTQSGGNGDIWMRLVSLYAIQPLVRFEIVVYVPKFFIPIAVHSFGERLAFASGGTPAQALIYTSLGIRNLIKPVLHGKRYISPYAKTVITDKKKKEKKDILNKLLYRLADSAGVIQLPPTNTINFYQGYTEVVAIKQFRHISIHTFTRQLIDDAPYIKSRLSHYIPTSSRLQIPEAIEKNTLVYPTGTGRQFVPVWWAKKYLPDAFYAFFYKDETAKLFEKSGLKTVYFYEEPGDIIELAKYAMRVISTDSFPSHLLQYAINNCTIAITEIASSRIISPAFKGYVTEATAPCHPCLHLDRENHPFCEAGYSECLNWKSELYTHNLLAALPVLQYR